MITELWLRVYGGSKGYIEKCKSALLGMGLSYSRVGGVGPIEYEDILVWENPENSNKGAYRVNFHKDVEPVDKSDTYDCISFRYWQTKMRMTEDVIRKNPMKNAISTVWGLIDGRIDIDERLTNLKSKKKLLKQYGYTKAM